MNTSKHTPGLPVCTCHIQTETVDTGIGAYEEYHIERCSLHTAAPAMYEALQTLVEYLSAQVPADTLDDWKHVLVARQALAQAEGRHS
mgnify:CR=1 FL=1